MAITQNPITGSSHGKFGSGIFYKKNGRNAFRSESVTRSDAQSTDQLTQRSRFEVASFFIRSIGDFCSVCWPSRLIKMPSLSYLMASVIHALYASEGGFRVNAALAFSFFSPARFIASSLFVNENDIVTIGAYLPSTFPDIVAGDHLYIAAYDHFSGLSSQILYFVPEDLTISHDIPLPGHLAGDDVELYFCLGRRTARKAADSLAQVTARNNTMLLTATGDGSGVATLNIASSELTHISIDGYGTFHLSPDALDEGFHLFDVLPGALRTVYIRLPRKTCNITFFEPHFITNFGTSLASGWISGTNAPSLSFLNFPFPSLVSFRADGNNSLSFDIQFLPVSLLYFVCLGQNTISGNIAHLNNVITHFLCTGQNTISGDIADLNNVITTFYCTGQNTISGNIADLNNVITTFFCTGQNTISGNIADLNNVITTFYCTGQNTISGNIADLNNVITNFLCYGLNSISGDIAHLNNVITSFRCSGQNSISGDISDLSDKILSFVCLGNNTINRYSSSSSFANNINHFSCLGSQGLPIEDITRLIIALDVPSWSGSSRLLNLPSPNASMFDNKQGGIWGQFDESILPSALSVACKSLIFSKTVAVYLNGVDFPGLSGDGIGLPSGFGDWWRS
jgi:hypothetical protein